MVGAVADGDGLIELVNPLQPDAIISDVGLKGLDGISATIEIRRRHPEVPIVLMTAGRDHAVRLALVKLLVSLLPPNGRRRVGLPPYDGFRTVPLLARARSCSAVWIGKVRRRIPHATYIM